LVNQPRKAQQHLRCPDDVKSVFVRHLERFVKKGAFLWGDNAANGYFSPAEAHATMQWEGVQRFLAPHPIDYTSILELACGRGRNSEIWRSFCLMLKNSDEY
jgi:hypothetical protein